jgi:hypothetical protein
MLRGGGHRVEGGCRGCRVETKWIEVRGSATAARGGGSRCGNGGSGKGSTWRSAHTAGGSCSELCRSGSGGAHRRRAGTGGNALKGGVVGRNRCGRHTPASDGGRRTTAGSGEELTVAGGSCALVGKG